MNRNEGRRMEQRLNRIEMIRVELVMNLRRVERVEDSFRVAGTMTGRSKDSLRHLHQIGLNFRRIESKSAKRTDLK